MPWAWKRSSLGPRQRAHPNVLCFSLSEKNRFRPLEVTFGAQYVSKVGNVARAHLKNASERILVRALGDARRRSDRIPAVF